MSRVTRATAGIACVVGGACTYQPRTFRWIDHPLTGARSTYGCVDVAVSRRPDVDDHPVVAFEFANGCDRTVTIDLAAIEVVGRDAEGGLVRLLPVDPGDRLGALPLEGRGYGREVIEYRAETPSLAAATVCVRAGAAFGARIDDRICFVSPNSATRGAAIDDALAGLDWSDGERGWWAAARRQRLAIFEMGLIVRQLHDPFAQSTPAGTLQRVAGPTAIETGPAAAWIVRGLVGLGRGFYGGLELGLGGLALDNGGEATIADYEAVLGARLPLGPANVSAEIAAGGRTTWIDGLDATRHQAVLEPRVLVDTWLSPWVTLGIVVGSDLVDHDRWMGGFTIGSHSWAYDGTR